jgi:hypothetical protein
MHRFTSVIARTGRRTFMTIAATVKTGLTES